MIQAVERVILVINHTGPRSCSLEGYNADGDDGVDVAIFSEQHPIPRAREYAELKYGVSDPEVVDPDVILWSGPCHAVTDCQNKPNSRADRAKPIIHR
jgi:hypothetical protein